MVKVGFKWGYESYPLTPRAGINSSTESMNSASLSSTGDTLRKRDNLLTGEGEVVGEEPLCMTARKPGPL